LHLSPHSADHVMVADHQGRKRRKVG